MSGIERLIDGTEVAVGIAGSEEFVDRSNVRALFPGAFNPLHQAHWRIAELARQQTGQPVDFEISIDNVDKPTLGASQIRGRVQQFGPEQRVWVTRAATFRDKSALFPGVLFLVGADTIERVADPQYYRGVDDRDETLAEFARHGCRFLVFGRLVRGEFLSLRELDLPAALVSLCEGVDEERFRYDISSTELRK